MVGGIARPAARKLAGSRAAGLSGDSTAAGQSRPSGAGPSGQVDGTSCGDGGASPSRADDAPPGGGRVSTPSADGVSRDDGNASTSRADRAPCGGGPIPASRARAGVARAAEGRGAGRAGRGLIAAGPGRDPASPSAAGEVAMPSPPGPRPERRPDATGGGQKSTWKLTLVKRGATAYTTGFPFALMAMFEPLPEFATKLRRLVMFVTFSRTTGSLKKLPGEFGSL